MTINRIWEHSPTNWGQQLVRLEGPLQPCRFMQIQEISRRSLQLQSHIQPNPTLPHPTPSRTDARELHVKSSHADTFCHPNRFQSAWYINHLAKESSWKGPKRHSINAGRKQKAQCPTPGSEKWVWKIQDAKENPQEGAGAGVGLGMLRGKGVPLIENKKPESISKLARLKI